ncbi:MAG: TIGR02099 family protein [Pseudomonadota bacterium]|nr:TIGR02099 family protein [Pseudomonadota bacterium]
MCVAFAAVVLWLRYDALPNVDRYRADIVASLEKSSGMKVKVRSLSGGWGGLRPVISLQGLEIADRRGKAAFQLERAEVTLSWWSLFAGHVLFHDVDFYRPDLELRRGADGLIYLADKPINAAGPDDDGTFTEWLLAQPRLGIHDATLTWRDDFGGAPEVRLTGVAIGVEKRHGRHRASLTAVPPPELAGRIDLRADVVLVRKGTRWGAKGEAYAESLNADLARLRTHLPVPETLRSGVGSLRMWLRFSSEGVDEVIADLRMRDARAQLAADALPLELASLAGRATYQANTKGFTFATEGLSFRLASGLAAQPGDFSLARTTEPGQAPRMEVRANSIDLKIAATLVDYFPVPRQVKGQVLRFAPRGRIADTTVAWSDDGAKAYAVKARFEDLAVNAVDNFPGVSGLSGTIEGTEAGGVVQLAATHSVFELGHFFRAPLAFARLEARAKWRHVERALEVQVVDAHFSNADADGRISGTWRSLPDARVKSPGYADLKGTFSRGSPARAANYLPNRIAATREWLERAVQGGEMTRATFELKGDLYEFPFGKESTGRFLFEGDIRNTRLAYHPNWPSIDAIDGTFKFENRRFEIAASRAAIFASRMHASSAVIEDLMAQPPLLTLDSDIDTTGADSVRFLRESPLVNGPGSFTRVVAIEGPARLKLHMEYPLWGTEPVRVAGDYLFAGATASVARNLQLRDVRGRLAFTERGVRAPELAGTMFGKPANLAMSTEPDGRLLTELEGAIDVPVLANYVPAPIAARLSGATEWKARVLSGPRGTDVTITSDLAGLASTLPEPVAKAAGDARALAIQIQGADTEGELTTATLAGGVFWRSRRFAPGGVERWQVALKTGAPVAHELARDGLWLYGEVAALDVDAWLAVFARAKPEDAAKPGEDRAQGLELRGIDLAMGRVRYLGREFAQMKATLERNGAQWNGKLEGPLVAGAVQWSPEGKGRVVARLDRLSIPEAKAAAPSAPQPSGDPDLPVLDVIADHFDFRGKALGRLELKAQHAGDEWRIDHLDITTEHSKFRSTGGWRRTGAGSITSLAIKLESENLNALMVQFGYGDYLKRGTGSLEGTIVWPGFPYDFSPAILSGGFKVDSKRGQFAKLDPGAGKLLGLLSLQSLPRRAMFDFRDVFSDGFAYDGIEGNVKIARGTLLTDDFQISGPSAFVSLSGEASLPQETQNLTLRVVPEVGEGMALAATLLGTPVLGLSTLLVSKLLKNPFGKAVAYEYQVTGSWDNPVVTRLSGAAPLPKAAAAIEAQK